MNHEAAGNGIKEISPSRREIAIEVPSDKVNEEFESILTDYAAKAKLAGFRKGKAPRDLVRRMFAAEIRKDAAESLVPRIFDEKLKESGVRPVSVPVIEDAHFEDDGVLHARVAFDVLPEFEIPPYTKIPLTRREATVEEKEIEEAIEALRQRAAEYVPAEGRGVVDGDYVVVEIQGKDVRSKKSFPLDKTVVLAGHAENDKSLNENLPGMTPGEAKTFTVVYAADDVNKKLAGKEIEYHLKVQSIKEKKVPELNDDLARTLGDYAGLEDLREKVRNGIRTSKEGSLRGQTTAELLGKISAGVTVELPASLVEDETRAVLRRVLNAYPQARLGKEQAEQLAAQSRMQAEQNIKNNLILTRIADKEGITVSDAEIEEELKTLAEANGVPLAKVVETVNKEGKRGDVAENILFRKTIDFLMGQAIIN